jgi:hypothetical protein
MRASALFVSVACTTALLASFASRVAAAVPDIVTRDVDRFYAIYHAADGAPTAEQLQRDYLGKASAGLLRFAEMRKITGERIAEALRKDPDMYRDARSCADTLPAVRTRLAVALDRLAGLYPQARLPAVTIAIGRGKPVGTANADGVMIGLEALCHTDFFEPNLEDRFVHVIAHEYVHVQQPAAQVEDPEEKVLRAALIEGGAEFIGELISGSISYGHLAAWAKGREKETETAFLADRDEKALGSDWLYNGKGTPERPGDLGYWVGYRIAKAYYQHAADKPAAIREIIEVQDADAFLKKSGWTPGIKLD